MKQGWKDLPPIAKFSLIAFIIALILGLMSLGFEGIGIYYAVEFALPVSIDSLHGDAVWPSMIIAGMAWSVGFLIAGLLVNKIRYKMRWILYVLILWIWAYAVWYSILVFEVVQ